MNNFDKYGIPGIVLFVFILLYGTGCETSFDPLQENNRYAFSMYGSLDLHADTQWVRVTPIQDSLLSQSTKPVDAEVTLTRESTGDTIALNDSLFFFDKATYAWNFWTAGELHPEELFTLKAVTSGGEKSQATIRIPKPLSQPESHYSYEHEGGRVSGEGVENLVVAESIFHVQVCFREVGRLSQEYELNFSHLPRAVVQENGEYYFDIEAWPLLSRELEVLPENIFINKREVIVASAREDWPDLSGLNEDEEQLPDVITNVENGSGYIAGIASRKILLEDISDFQDNRTCEKDRS